MMCFHHYVYIVRVITDRGEQERGESGGSLCIFPSTFMFSLSMSISSLSWVCLTVDGADRGEAEQAVRARGQDTITGEHHHQILQTSGARDCGPAAGGEGQFPHTFSQQ